MWICSPRSGVYCAEAPLTPRAWKTRAHPWHFPLRHRPWPGRSVTSAHCFGECGPGAPAVGAAWQLLAVPTLSCRGAQKFLSWACPERTEDMFTQKRVQECSWQHRSSRLKSGAAQCSSTDGWIDKCGVCRQQTITQP